MSWRAAKIVIVAGYQGMSYRREITTLGRGGSDTTAVALAAALSAERCEIYSDVDGVYSADPRVVPDAAHLPTLDLATLGEMAEAGAKVLNAQAVEWARRAKIAIFARKTNDPVGAGRETVAAGEAPSSDARVRGVVGVGNIAEITCSASVQRLAAAAAESGLALYDLSGDERGAHAVVALANVPDFAERRAVLERLASPLEIRTDGALVSLVGAELAGEAANVAKALEDAGAHPRFLTSGPLRISATIPAGALDAAQRALHARFVSAI